METWCGMRCAFVPPYLLSNLADRHDDPSLRESAARALRLDQVHRAARLAGLRALPRDSEPKREIANAHNTQRLPGDVARKEGQQASGDTAVDQAYDNLGITHWFYRTVFARNSIDNAAGALLATVHYDEKYDNAFWNGQRMVYGDGDGQIFQSFTNSLDVTAHELTHGVTQATANLDYEGQSGALNESVSDVFGVLVKQHHLQQSADQTDWLVGVGLFSSKVHGVALRSLKAPGTAYDDPVLGKDPQPASMADYVETFEDNGGVHINSGIPNHAFYLLATELGGFAWERAGKIWYETLTGGAVSHRAKFADFAKVTVDTAGRLFGGSSAEKDAVTKAWKTVGVIK